jgi:hypothetical protein
MGWPQVPPDKALPSRAGSLLFQAGAFTARLRKSSYGSYFPQKVGIGFVPGIGGGMTSIRINVYDLTWLNTILRFAHIGVYHTSVVIGEKDEVYFGFAAAGRTGIDTSERINHLPRVMPGSFYKTIPMGTSQFDSQQCRRIFRRFLKSKRWLSDYYHMLFHNCNDFTYELCMALLGEDGLGNFPHWAQRGVSIAGVLYSLSVGYIIGLKTFPIRALGEPPPPAEEDERRVVPANVDVTPASSPPGPSIEEGVVDIEGAVMCVEPAREGRERPPPDPESLESGTHSSEPSSESSSTFPSTTWSTTDFDDGWASA